MAELGSGREGRKLVANFEMAKVISAIDVGILLIRSF